MAEKLPQTEKSLQAEIPPKVQAPNTIHVDSFSIKVKDGTNESKVSEEEKKRLIFEISQTGKDEILIWIDHIFSSLGILVALGVFSGMYAYIKYSINKQISKQLERLDEARQNATSATRATVLEIEESRNSLRRVRQTQSTLDEKLLSVTSEAQLLEEKIKNLKESAVLTYEDLRVDFKDDIEYLATGDLVQTKWLKAIDTSNAGSDKVIDSLINDLNKSDDAVRIPAAEQLSYLDDVNEKILQAYEKLLKTESETKFGAVILSKIGKLDKGDKVFNILSDLSQNLDSTNTAAVIGAIGNLQEKRMRDPIFISKIVDKLIDILKQLNLKISTPESTEYTEIANKKNAVALSLTYSGSMGGKAVPLLIEMVDDKSDNEYRKSAAIALGNIGKKAIRAIPALKNLLQDPLPQMSSVAELAIEKINKT